MTYNCKHWTPHITVATVVEQDGKFLCVEEISSGKKVINQPSGHVERGESIVDTAIRETLEETGYLIKPRSVVALQRWHKPNSDDTYFRTVIAADIVSHHPEQELDSGIIQPLWLSRDDITRLKIKLRSPVVEETIDTYLSGQRLPLSLLQDFS